MQLEQIGPDRYPPVQLTVNGKEFGQVQAISAHYDDVPGYKGKQLLRWEITLTPDSPPVSETTFFDRHGTLRNPDGTRSIFDDVDA